MKPSSGDASDNEPPDGPGPGSGHGSGRGSSHGAGHGSGSASDRGPDATGDGSESGNADGHDGAGGASRQAPEGGAGSARGSAGAAEGAAGSEANPGGASGGGETPGTPQGRGGAGTSLTREVAATAVSDGAPPARFGASPVPSADGAYDRQPPVSLEAEISVLGGMLIDPDSVPRAVEHVNDTMFYREAHRRLFRTMVRLFEQGVVVDVITVADALRKQGELDAVGGMGYLAEVLDAVPTAANIEYHARIVAEKAVLRRLIDASSQIIRDVYDQGERAVAEVVDQAEQRIFQVAQSHDRQGFVWIKEILWPTFEHIDELQKSASGLTGVATGFPVLDHMTTGLQKGDLVIVAARPSMGKTSWVLNVAQNAAIDHEVPVAIFSLEMSKEQLVQRLLCAEGRVDAQKLRGGRLTSEEHGRLASAAAKLNTAPIWIDDSPGASVLEMRAKARRLKADTDIGLLVIDYMQLMTGGARVENRQQEVSEISRGLKALARELEVPVVALSQLSRGPEQRNDHRPQLSDLRDSGSIEQDADLVMFLYRPEYYAARDATGEPVDKEGNSLTGAAELIIGKQRNGPTGTIKLYFHKNYTRFDSVDARPGAGASQGGRSGAGGGGGGYGQHDPFG